MEKHCIARGCGLPFDPEAPELRENETLRPFWQRYCPAHRVTGKRYEAITAIDAHAWMDMPKESASDSELQRGKP